MSLRAVLLPGTALLVPGAAGAAEVLATTRAEVLAALRRLVASAPAGIVLVAPGERSRHGLLRASLGEAGIDGRWLGWREPDATPADRSRAVRTGTAGVAASVGLLALAGAGNHQEVEVVELTGRHGREGSPGSATGTDDLALVAEVARRVAKGAALVVVGDLSDDAPPVRLLLDVAARHSWTSSVVATVERLAGDQELTYAVATFEDLPSDLTR
ncbi:hypothetical protein [Oerskovia flava]|uniref:hypothetical protein n=1 Tax=Oerskovia flava TaxID=2986422 RepID=UPI00223FF614|nr:hypothetical protein [Oerskovia sp. JB1-3-2]